MKHLTVDPARTSAVNKFEQSVLYWLKMIAMPHSTGVQLWFMCSEPDIRLTGADNLCAVCDSVFMCFFCRPKRPASPVSSVLLTLRFLCLSVIYFAVSSSHSRCRAGTAAVFIYVCASGCHCVSESWRSWHWLCACKHAHGCRKAHSAGVFFCVVMVTIEYIFQTQSPTCPY